MKLNKKDLFKIIDRERFLKDIFAELNKYIDLKTSLSVVLDLIKRLTSFEAVGIRLLKNGDYPYYTYDGFPESFIEKENSLCVKDASQKLIKDPGGGYMLECMCGNVLKGRVNPELPFFSANGSFWSNSTSRLLAASTQDERQGNTRNYCNSCGYESVMLVPIKHHQKIIGLIQLNDKRMGLVTGEAIEFLEIIASQIWVSIENRQLYDILKDINVELGMMKDYLKHESETDALTGVPNRRFLVRALEIEIKNAERYRTDFSIIIFDIDEFKNVNNNYGHNAGDRVLKNLAGILKENTRDGDIFGRWGGDEFMIFITRNNWQDARQLAEKLRKIIENFVVGNTNPVTSSFGLTQYIHDDDVDSIVMRADKALYKAKENGKNCVEVVL